MKTFLSRATSLLALAAFAAAIVFVYHFPNGLIALAVIAAVMGLLAFLLPSDVFNFLVRRIVLGLLTLWVIVTLIFLLFFASGQDPARSIAGRAATPALLNNIRKELGLTQPLPVQYAHYIGDLLHGNLHNSYANGQVPVIDIVKRAIPIDISLAFGASIIWVTVGLSVGILAARRPRTVVDRSATAFVLGCISMPTFTLGLLLLYFFYYLLNIGVAGLIAVPYALVTLGVGIASVYGAWRSVQSLRRGFSPSHVAGLAVTAVLGLLFLRAALLFGAAIFGGPGVQSTFFPGGGIYTPFTKNPLEWAHDLILPWLTLAMITAATYSRLSRSSLLDTLGEDYIRTARAKGLSERRVVYRHALRSAMTPIVTQFGIDVATILGGAIVTETVFSLPGLGYTAVQALTKYQDLPTIQAVALLASAFIIAANIIVDASYALLDPRVRVS